MIFDRLFRAEFKVPTLLNETATFFLIPTHYMFGKRTVEIVESNAIRQSPLSYEKGHWKKTIAMVIFLIPSLITGISFRLLSLTSPSIRHCLTAPLPGESQVTWLDVRRFSKVRRRLLFDSQ